MTTINGRFLMALMPGVMESAMFDACNDKMKLNRSGNWDNFATIKNPDCLQ